jgi:hypothetical protein
MVAGCLRNNQYATLIKAGRKGAVLNDLMLDLFARAAQLVPTGKQMKYDTFSNFLVEQWDDMMGWKRIGYPGLDHDACAPNGRRLWGMLERAQVELACSSQKTTLCHEAARLYAMEGIERTEEDLALPVDSSRRQEAPWF